ncbi:MAG TPA: amino acid adenylation domain-containing protein, partial [Telluria sp.]|nr:amino acid adenylation domain-containing protein [Telluria sp.]
SLNVKLDVQDGKLRIQAPAGVVTPDLQAQIREHKDSLVALLGQSWQGKASEPLPQIEPDPASRHDPFPLNDVQHAYWIGRQAHFDLGNVATHFYFEVDAEDLDLDRLARAFNKVIAQQDMLRAVTDANGQQRILSSVPFYEIAETDLSAASESEREAALAQMRDAQSHRHIPSDRWPLFQVTSARTGERQRRLFMSWDFIFLDAWSILLIFKEWHKCYADEAYTPPQLTLSFRDYVLAEARLKETPAYRRAHDYWWSRIDTLPDAPQLPVVPRADSAAAQTFTRRRFELPAAKWEAMKARASKRGITPSSLLLATFAEILNLWSKSPHYSLNLTVFNRQPLHPEVGELVGDFTNLIVLEVDGRKGESFRERALSLQEQFLRDYDHREVSAVEVLREMAKRRGSQGRAILPVVFTSTLMLNGSRSDDSAGLERFGPMVWGISQTPQVWLDYQIFEFNGNLVFNWDAVDAMFEPGVLDAMFEANRALISALAEGETPWEQDALVRLPAPQDQRRVEANATAAALPAACLHEGFVAQALEHPERVAVICGGREIRYGELLARACALADELRERGAEPGQLVAVVMDKGWEQVVAVMAVLIAGAAYLPLDVRWPALRRAQVMQRCDVRLALVRPGQGEGLELPPGVATLEVEETAPQAAPRTAPPLRQSLSDLAYVIFTSGSTGEPKGVVIDHRGAVNTVMHINLMFGVGPQDKVLGVSELGFDLSVYDVFGLLAAGGTLVIPDGPHARDPQLWVDLMTRHGITVWNSAPQLMVLLTDMAEARQASLPALRLCMMSGDWIPVRLPDRIRALARDAQVISLGGATEGSIWSIYYPVGAVDPDWDSIPYGKALPNQTMYVLNKRLEMCPDLATGDIYIGGIGVALGYWRDEEKTAQRFIVHPGSGERLYWTGDLGRYLPDGNIQFLGREDSQVKLRGYRVELGEIAAQLQSHPGVQDAAVQVLKQDGRQVLAAWMVGAAEDARLAPAEIAAWLGERLPEYMVPQRFTLCASFPLNANGKVDLAALARDHAPIVGAERTAAGPRSPMQAKVLAVWEEVLGVHGLGTNDNFFEAGGDSLLLTAVLRKLNAGRTRQLSMAELFSYPTVQALAAYLEQDEPAPLAAPAVQAPQQGGDIAIIGMAGRFPDAANPEELWDKLVAGHSAIRQFSDAELRAAGVPEADLDQPNYVKAGPVLADMALFDAAYFGMPPVEAAFIDPQQRFLLECAVEALEDAGYPSEQQAGRVGVFVGKGTPRYMVDHVLPNADAVRTFGTFTIMNGHDKDHAATYVSYKLNLTGPSVSVNTSCSTSLVAVHNACQSLREGECEIALAGGVSFMSTLECEGYLYQDGHITSPDGHCRAFSDDARGVVFGSGAGLVVLKPLAAALRDGDTIHAVIKGSAINNDGARKVGYTAPSLHGQARAIAEAQRRAGIAPEAVGLIEAHGTGTNLGDPVEVGALRQVFGGARADGSTVALGSVKSNIGHLDVAAGITGLIKAVQAVKHGQLPPTLHAEVPNRKIDFADTPFQVNSALRPWQTAGQPRIAGVSSFGVGGTNAHVVLQEAPAQEHAHGEEGPALLVLSAKSPSALDAAGRRLAQHLDQRSPALRDVAFTLQQGRIAHRFRRHIVAVNVDHAVAQLSLAAAGAPAEARENEAASVAFLFPGQGAQRHGSSAALYRDSAPFRTAFDQCAELALTFGAGDLRAVLYGDAGALIDQTEITQPLLFALEYALARHWMALGIRPAAMLGHSLGEYVAACLAGVFTLEEALSLVVVRGQLIATLERGAMLAVSATEAELAPLLARHGCDLAAVNGPMQCVAAGSFAAIERLRAELAQAAIPAQQLHTSHAFHSAMMDSIVETFTACVAATERQAPAIPFVSCVTGDWISAEQAASPEYWGRHLRATVRFGDAVRLLNPAQFDAVLEVGPGRTLCALAAKCGLPPARCIPSLAHEGGEAQAILHAAGRLWALGAAPDWKAMSGGGRRIPLPTYAWDHKRHWIEYQGRPAPVPAVRQAEADAGAEAPAPAAAGMNPTEARLAAIWREFLGVEQIGVHDNFFDLGGDSLTATRVYA